MLLGLVARGMAFERFYSWQELRSCEGDSWWTLEALQIAATLLLAKVWLFFFPKAFQVFAFLVLVPAGEGTSLWARAWDAAYWLVLGFFSIFFVAPGLGLSL